MKIKSGMFIRTNTNEMGIVVNDIIVYQTGGYSELKKFDENGKGKYFDIVEIYDSECFNECDSINVIWKAPIGEIEY